MTISTATRLTYQSSASVTRPIHYTTFTESPFAGPKFPQTDSAWAGLLAGINIRVSSSDVESSHLNTSVALPKGGYLAWPEAMHQLHCVKRIREWVHRAEYHPDLDGDDEAHWLKHMGEFAGICCDTYRLVKEAKADARVDHCIELLRQSVMCVPDKALMGFHWEEDTSRPVLNMKGPEHQCGDWDAYVRSVRERSVDSVEMKELSRPVYL